MTAKCFVDTNILLYSVDERAGEKHAAARRFLATDLREQPRAVSTQVIMEFYSAATRKLKIPPARARSLTTLWTEFEVVSLGPDDVLNAIDCSIVDGLSIWDALIVTAARKANCETLWTEDLGHGQLIQGVRIENPFLRGKTVREAPPKYRTRRTARSAK
jgi:predicted nucleic acid-binding protein